MTIGKKVLIKSSGDQTRAVAGAKIKNSHILMNNQHVKIKKFPHGETADSQERSMRTSIIGNPETVPTAQIVPGHKKANSLMNQKMMQLIMNKEYGNNMQNNQMVGNQPMMKSHQIEASAKVNVGHQQRINSQTYHHEPEQQIITSQNPEIMNVLIQNGQYQMVNNFMNNEFISSTQDNTSKQQSLNQHAVQDSAKHSTPPTIKQRSVKLQAEVKQQLMPNNIIKQTKIKHTKTHTVDFNVGQKTLKVSKPIMVQNYPKIKQSQIGSSSFDKSGKSSSISKRPHPDQMSVNHEGGAIVFNKMHEQMTQYPNVSIIGTGTTSIINTSTSNLPMAQNHSIRESNVQSVIANHQRTLSDPNYIMGLNSKNKSNIVISSSNHVYQNKKTANLKAMDNNASISNHGATKGFLNKMGQVQVTKSFGQKPGQNTQTGHKKNQYSTIVKSNYKNLVESLSENNDQEEGPGGVKEKGTDLEVFQSNQNKTTEQKYAELKTKYNDLLNKHLNLAALKTVDNRVSTNKTGQTSLGKKLKIEAQNNKQGISHTQKPSISKPISILTSNQIRKEKLGEVSQSKDGQKLQIKFIDNKGVAVHNMASNFTSQNQSPRGQINQRGFQINQSQEDNDDIMDDQCQVIDGSEEKMQGFEGIKQNINAFSRMEGQGPLVTGQSPLINKVQTENQENKERQNLKGVAINTKKSTSYAISHKRSVSDEIFNKIIPSQKAAQNPSHQQQIPLKQKTLKVKNQSFENRNKKMRGDENNDDKIIINDDAQREHHFTIENRITYSHEENLLTDMGAEFNFHIHDQLQQNIFIKDENPVVEKVHAYQDSNLKSGQRRGQVHTIQTEHSNKKLTSSNLKSIAQEQNQTENSRKKKKTKSILNSLQVNENALNDQIKAGKLVPDIDMNILANKYQQLRMNDKGLIASEVKNSHGNQTSIHSQKKVQATNIQIIKASGKAERFANEQSQFDEFQAVKAKAHRRVKSGVPDSLAQNSLKMPFAIQQLTKNQGKVVKQVNDRVPSVGQRSLESINNLKPQKNFMLIYEEKSNEQSSHGHEPLKTSDEMMLYQSQLHDSRGNKVINVSFNDFSHSMDNANVENSVEIDGEASSKNTKNIHQIQTSNKNLNNFLEALQKIKPQNPVAIPSPQRKQNQNQVQVLTSQSPINNSIKPRRANLSEIPAGSVPQARQEKYQKMMTKVKSSEKKTAHNRIKSTNEAMMAGHMFIDNQRKTQPMNKSTDRQRSNEQSLQGGSQVIQGDIDQNNNQKLKITFVGDQALLKKQMKNNNPVSKSSHNPLGAKETSKVKPIQFHHNPGNNLIGSATNSNTGGEPSPIISTKRVPQKIHSQLGDTSISPPQSREGKNIFGIQKNNFVADPTQFSSPQGFIQNKMKAIDQSEPNNISDFDQSKNYSQMEDQHNLIYNLNKGIQFLDDPNAPHFDLISQPRVSDLNFLVSPTAPQVSERLVTDDSAGMRNGQDTPRGKNIRMLTKMIKLSYRQTQQPPDTNLDFYRIGKVLGKGAFGKANLAVHKLTECLCAIKSINKKQFFSDESQSKKVMQEVIILKRIKHKNVVRLFEYFETDKHLLFVIELCAGGDLLNYVRRRRRLKEDVAKCLFKQIIESLAYIHKKNILHRDIKLDNILLDSEGQVKICDFGVGKIVKKGEKMTEQCGTPAYIAPEILRDQGYYGFAVDIWSAGVVLYAMLYGTVPFKASNMSELQKIIMKAKYSLREDISVEARELLKGMMEKDPAKRLTISDILQHPWLADVVDQREIELFTEQEKQYIRSEFTYSKSKRFNRNLESSALGGFIQSDFYQSNTSGLGKDMFTEHMLDSTQNSTLKNCETKSVILAPFNSTKSNLNQEDPEEQPFVLSDSIKELIAPRKIIKFGARVRDIDRQYEINNNADLDNGVYHKLDEDEENKDDENKSDDKSDKNSQELNKEESEIMLDEEEQEILKELKKQGKKKKENQKSEKLRLQNMIQDEEEKIEGKYLLLPEQMGGGGGNLNTEISQVSPHNISQLSQLHSVDRNQDIQLNSPVAQNQNNIKIIENLDFYLKSEGNNLATSPSQLGHLTNREEANEYMMQLYQQQNDEENIVIQEKIVNIVEEFGYPRQYVLKSIQNQDLNYAYTSYLLMHFLRKAQEVKQHRMFHSSNQHDTPESQNNAVRIVINPQNSECSTMEKRERAGNISSNANSIPDMN